MGNPERLSIHKERKAALKSLSDLYAVLKAKLDRREQDYNQHFIRGKVGPRAAALIALNDKQRAFLDKLAINIAFITAEEKEDPFHRGRLGGVGKTIATENADALATNYNYLASTADQFIIVMGKVDMETGDDTLFHSITDPAKKTALDDVKSWNNLSMDSYLSGIETANDNVAFIRANPLAVAPKVEGAAAAAHEEMASKSASVESSKESTFFFGIPSTKPREKTKSAETSDESNSNNNVKSKERSKSAGDESKERPNLLDPATSFVGRVRAKNQCVPPAGQQVNIVTSNAINLIDYLVARVESGGGILSPGLMRTNDSNIFREHYFKDYKPSAAFKKNALPRFVGADRKPLADGTGRTITAGRVYHKALGADDDTITMIKGILREPKNIGMEEVNVNLDLIESTISEGKTDPKKSLSAVLKALPASHIRFLLPIFMMSQQGVAHADVNKMTSTNVAISIGPSLIKFMGLENSNPMEALTQLSQLQAVVETWVKLPPNVLEATFTEALQYRHKQEEDYSDAMVDPAGAAAIINESLNELIDVEKLRIDQIHEKDAKISKKETLSDDESPKATTKTTNFFGRNRSKSQEAPAIEIGGPTEVVHVQGSGVTTPTALTTEATAPVTSFNARPGGALPPVPAHTTSTTTPNTTGTKKPGGDTPAGGASL